MNAEPNNETIETPEAAKPKRTRRPRGTQASATKRRRTTLELVLFEATRDLSRAAKRGGNSLTKLPEAYALAYAGRLDISRLSRCAAEIRAKDPATDQQLVEEYLRAELEKLLGEMEETG